jgi:hypothetical protein
MIDSIQLRQVGKHVDDIMFDKCKAWMPKQMGHIRQSSGHQIVNRNDMIAIANQTIAKVGPNKPRPTANQGGHRFPLHE